MPVNHGGQDISEVKSLIVHKKTFPFPTAFESPPVRPGGILDPPPQLTKDSPPGEGLCVGRVGRWEPWWTAIGRVKQGHETPTLSQTGTPRQLVQQMCNVKGNTEQVSPERASGQAHSKRDSLCRAHTSGHCKGDG